MDALLPEFRLAAAILLNAAVFTAAWRFVRRRVTSDAFDRATDVLLLCFVIQYVSVALPGILGILNFASLAITALAISTALVVQPFLAAKSRLKACTTITTDNPVDRWSLRAATAFTIAYLANVVANMSLGFSPVTANDALTYHFPAAIQWLQTGRLGVYQTWFFNPANTYSPLAGSTFIAWWIAPLGNSLLARFVQAPAHLLIFFAVLRIMRSAGVRPAVAAILAAAIAASQPLIRQSIIEKDDLYLAAFFACIVGAMSKERLTDALGSWRVGIAIGMMLATKYIALMIAPALLLLIDAPFRAGWRARQWLVAVATALLLAGPWYARNLILTGNPLHPMGSLFSSARTMELPGQIWHILTRRDQSLPVVPMIALLVGAIAAIALHFRGIVREPLRRIILIGHILLVLIFAFTSPYPEARFIYAAFVLLLAAAALAIQSLPAAFQFVAAGIIFIAATVSGVPSLFLELLLPTAIAMLGVMLGVLFAYDRAGAKQPRFLAVTALIAVLITAAAIYVYWPGHVTKSREAVALHYTRHYDPIAHVWMWIEGELPPRELIAYTNTFLVLPLTDFNHDRPIVYVPTRKNVSALTDLPRWQGKFSGETVLPQILRELFAEPDDIWWLEGLRKSGAKHIVIFRNDAGPRPPELDMIARNRARFELLLDHPAGLVYRIR